MTRRAGLAALLAVVAAMAGVPALAEVTHLTDQGFATSTSLETGAPRETVWAALIEPELWWSKQHSWFGERGRFWVTPAAGGCFCESLPNDEPAQIASAEHMRVVNVVPGAKLVMTGALGPLQGEALSAVLTVSLEPSGHGTRVTWSYVVGGFSRYPFEQLAPAVDGVMSEQARRLAAFVDTGAPQGH